MCCFRRLCLRVCQLTEEDDERLMRSACWVKIDLPPLKVCSLSTAKSGVHDYWSLSTSLHHAASDIRGSQGAHRHDRNALG